MRICLFSTTFFPKIGGAEFVIHYLANYLTKLGHKVTVLVPKYGEVKEEIGYDYSIHRYQLLPRLFLLEPTLITHIVLEKIKTKFDILHAHFTYPSGYCAIKLKKFFRIPVVVTPYGDVQVLPEVSYGIRLNPKIDKKVKFTLRNADGITAISNSIREEIIKAGGEEKGIYDIPCGVDTQKFNKPTKDLRQMLDLLPGTKLILSVGRYGPRKGFSELLKALPEVLSEYPQTKCIIVGEGTENLITLARELGVEDALILAGSISTEELISIYLGADIFVFPSLIEGFGLVTVEAMAAGLPIIVTDIPGSRDIIKSGINGLIVPPSDPEALAAKIIELLENDNLRHTISQNAKLEAKEYDWELIAKKYAGVYQDILKRSGLNT